MWLHRVTPDPFENSKSETSALGQSVDEWTGYQGVVIAKFNRFGLKSRRSDFEVQFEWSDIEELIARFSAAKHPSAVELQGAIHLAKVLVTAGWKPPEISN
jgi:hypothetical protein